MTRKVQNTHRLARVVKGTGGRWSGVSLKLTGFENEAPHLVQIADRALQELKAQHHSPD